MAAAIPTSIRVRSLNFSKDKDFENKMLIDDRLIYFSFSFAILITISKVMNSTLEFTT